MIEWRIHHVAETRSTNLDARGGRHGDVFTADYQTAGRGRIGHRWQSRAGENLMMSVVLGVADIAPEVVATLPLAVGLATVESLGRFIDDLRLKWPNDVLADGRKLAGILCERNGDSVIAGIGVNVNQSEFPAEIAERATSLCGRGLSVGEVRDAVLHGIDRIYGEWLAGGFGSLVDRMRKVDFLYGRRVSVVQTDDDQEPVTGIAGGITSAGALLVGDAEIYAGEAHVESWQG